MNAFKEYRRLLGTHPRYLTFGMLHMFYSSPGQSFAVAMLLSIPAFPAPDPSKQADTQFLSA